MDINLAQLLNDSDVMLVFTALAFGLLLGKLKLGNFQLGSTPGVLLVAILFGHWGFEIEFSTESLGFMLFIFCVGIEAGPNFFSSFAEDGLKYICLAAVVALSGIAITYTAAQLLDIEKGLSAGMLAGSLTSSPTLAGAQGAAVRLTSDIGVEGRDALIGQISVGYAITYVVGLLGLLAVIQLLPRLLGMQLADAAREIAIERGMLEGRRRTIRTPILRAYIITPETAEKLDGRTLRELGMYERIGLSVERIKRDGEIFIPDSETVIQEGDAVALVGYPSSHSRSNLAEVEETFDADLLEFQIVSQPIVIATTRFVGRTLQELELQAQHGCFAESVQRAQIPLPVRPDLRLNRGDILMVSGEQNRVDNLASELGFIEKASDSTDLMSFSSFFVLGLLFAQLNVLVGDISVTLGSAGGLLATGILMGYFRTRNPLIGNIPQGAINVLKDLGLNLFMVGVGLNAGGSVVETLYENGAVLILCGLAIALIPLLAGYLVGHLAMRMNPALLMGALTGAMTSTPALATLIETSRSHIPALGYAGTYTFANVFLTLGGAALITI
jgi:putative transport protein